MTVACLDCGHTWGHTKPTSTRLDTHTPSNSPADDLRQRWDWRHELAATGWQLAKDGHDSLWTRPGKPVRDGHSAVLHGNDVLVIFTTDIPDDLRRCGTITVDGSGYSFSPFDFYTGTRHGGDASAATRALRAEMTPHTPTATPDAPQDDTELQEDDWSRRDLVEIGARILDGTHQPEVPVFLHVDGALPLIYRGRIHSIFGPPGGGKTWVALAALVERLKAGEHVLMIDWEDVDHGTAQRLIQLGCTLDDLARFDYRNPVTSLAWGMPLLKDDHTPWTLIVIDSAGEALAAEGVELVDDGGTANWFGHSKKLIRRPERPAVIMLDHVPKTSGDEPAKYAIGSQRKLAAITGASYRCDTVVEPAKGKDGRLKLVVAKDRQGNRAKGSTACEIHIHDEDGGAISLGFAISEAQAAHERGEKFRPTHLMEKVSRWLEINPGATRRQIEDGVTGKTTVVRQAVDILIEEGFIAVDRNSRSHSHTVTQDYREAVDNSSISAPSTPSASLRPKCVPSASRDALNPENGSASPASPAFYSGGRRDALPGGSHNFDGDALNGPETRPVDNLIPADDIGELF